MRKLVERIILFVLGALSVLGILFLSYPMEEPIETLNKWFKISTDNATPEIVALDMSRGYSICEDQIIYIVVTMVDSDEEVVIAFPDGGYWTAPEPDPFLLELQKEFDSLEDYLNNNKSKEIKKK